MKQIEAWLKYINMTEIPRKVIISQIRKNISFDSLNETECVVCGKDNVGVCSYCFFNKVSRILSNMKLKNDFIEDFLASFNYVHSHEQEEHEDILEVE
jgi:hypothetical protein